LQPPQCNRHKEHQVNYDRSGGIIRERARACDFIGYVTCLPRVGSCMLLASLPTGGVRYQRTHDRETNQETKTTIVMSFARLKSTCPFCPKPFKTSGQLSNYLEKENPECRLSTKRKFGETQESNSDTYSFIKLLELGTHSYEFTSELAAIRAAFPNADFVLQETPQQDNHSEYRCWMPYSFVLATTFDTNSDCVSSSNHTEVFPVDRQAGHILVNTPFHYARHLKYNFFRPFAHVLNYKLARFFHTAYVPKARIHVL